MFSTFTPFLKRDVLLSLTLLRTRSIFFIILAFSVPVFLTLNARSMEEHPQHSLHSTLIKTFVANDARATDSSYFQSDAGLVSRFSFTGCRRADGFSASDRFSRFRSLTFQRKRRISLLFIRRGVKADCFNPFVAKFQVYRNVPILSSIF